MTEDIIKLTKFDVAERQLNQAIALFFGRGDAVSIHHWLKQLDKCYTTYVRNLEASAYFVTVTTFGKSIKMNG